MRYLILTLGLALMPSISMAKGEAAIKRALPTKRSTIKVYKKVNMDEERTVVIRGGIRESMSESIVADITSLDKDSAKPIFLIIRSPGGSVDAGFSIVTAMESARSQFVCAIDSEAYSMAAIIAAYCDQVFIHKYASLMHHEAAFGVQAQVSRVKIRVKFILDQLDVLEQGILTEINKKRARAGLSILTRAEYDSMIQAEWWMTATQAVEMGLADGIINELQYDWEPPKQLPFFQLFGDQEDLTYFDFDIKKEK